MKSYSMKFVNEVLSYRVDHLARDTCAHFKIAPSTLIDWIRKHGREHGLSMRHGSKGSNDDIQMMRALRNDGMTLDEIADKFDVSSSFVCNNTTKPSDLMSATALVDAIKSGSMPTKTMRIMIKNKIVGTFVPE